MALGVDGLLVSVPGDTVRTTSVLSVSNKDGTRKYNQYALGEWLGKGRHGEVYQAMDVLRDCSVALKIVKRVGPQDKSRLLRRSHHLLGQVSKEAPAMSSTEQTVRKEIAVMKTCQHINLVKLFEVIDDIQHDRIYLAMELVSGGPIPWRTASDEPVLTIDQTRRIIRDVILGLDYLHYHGIIHRDIKPSNIMWSEDRVAKIIDFGVSHYIHEGAAPGQSCLHLEDDVIFPEKDLKRTIGTPKFIAPEVVWFSDHHHSTSTDTLATATGYGTATGNTDTSNLPAAAAARPPITKAIDVWALGVTFYCLLFGKTPFNVSSNSNTHSRHSEYILYKTIRTQDWSVPQIMGREAVPTGGRHPGDIESEGYAFMDALDQMLQKDPMKRMSIYDLKRHRVFLKDVYDPEKWLQITSPVLDPPASRCWFRRAISYFCFR